MKKAAAFMAGLFLLVVLSGCSAGNSNPASADGAAGASSGLLPAASAAGGNSAAENGKKPSDGIDSNAESIEKMLNYLAGDSENVTVEDSQSADADSLANQLNGYLSDNTDDIGGLN